MGREAGFIAAGATIASGEVNFTLIPEVPFTLEGEGGLLAKLERRLAARQHAVIVVAEGAGQDLLAAAGGNVRRLGQSQAGRHRHVSQGADQGTFSTARDSRRREILRPELPHPQLPREHGRQPAVRSNTRATPPTPAWRGRPICLIGAGAQPIHPCAAAGVDRTDAAALAGKRLVDGGDGDYAAGSVVSEPGRPRPRSFVLIS